MKIKEVSVLNPRQVDTQDNHQLNHWVWGTFKEEKVYIWFNCFDCIS